MVEYLAQALKRPSWEEMIAESPENAKGILRRKTWMQKVSQIEPTSNTASKPSITI